MRDFIFIIGAPAVGKTTLAKELYKYYNGVYIEQEMVPEFMIPEKCEDEGIFEEEVCWDNIILQAEYFLNKGFKNIIVLDFDDLRAREIPIIFKGYNYIILKLISSNPEQIKEQMIKRKLNGNGLYDIENSIKINHKIMKRELLPNEVLIDVFKKTKEVVLKEAIDKIDNRKSQLDYNYEMDDKENYDSWVKSNNLRDENPLRE